MLSENHEAKDNKGKNLIVSAGEMMGIKKLEPNVVSIISTELQSKVREILQEAKKIMNHSKHSSLTPTHVKYSMNKLNIQQLYGYENCAPLEHSRAPKSSLYFSKNHEINLGELSSEPLFCEVDEIKCEFHWLALNGKQPLVPQNIVTNPRAKALISKQGLTRSNLANSEKMKENYEKNDHHVFTIGNSGRNHQNLREEGQISKELMTFYSEYNNTLENEIKIHANSSFISFNLLSPQYKKMLNLLKSEPCMKLIIDYITKSLLKQNEIVDKLEYKFCILSSIQSILQNPYLNIELQLHNILTMLLSILFENIPSQKTNSSIFLIKDYSSFLLSVLLYRFETKYSQLKKNIITILLENVLENEALLPIYGGIMGLCKLGGSVVESFIFPNLPQIVQRIEGENVTLEESPYQRRIKDQCLNALVIGIVNCMKESKIPWQSDSVLYKNLKKVFGDKLHVYSHTFIHRETLYNPLLDFI